jgi:hypothetical protein
MEYSDENLGLAAVAGFTLEGRTNRLTTGPWHKGLYNRERQACLAKAAGNSLHLS